VSTDPTTSDPRTALAEAIESVARSGDLDATLDGVLAAAATALQPAMGAVFVQDPDRPGLHPVATHGIDAAAGARLAAEVADPAHPFTVAATGRIATFDREATAPDGTTFIGAYLPLVVSTGGVDVSLGSIGLMWPAPRELNAVERETLTALAALAAVAIDRSRLGSTAAERSEWFERMAHTDPLTGLANERTVGRVLELELARAGRGGDEVSLVMFDIDDFRATNRDGGNEAGDDVLRQVAAVLAESVRLVDTVGRIGGDEFVVVAPGAAGSVVAERVMRGIAALPAVGGRVVSISAGVARFPDDGEDAQALIAAATAALERARTEGRGTVGSGVQSPD
jgi:diguanylate cyclase (GGDEF)-like protein